MRLWHQPKMLEDDIECQNISDYKIVSNLKWPSLVLCLCVCSHRTGVWLSDAKASVHMWRQQQSPRACWEDTKHLVPTTGERPEGPVWGMLANCNYWSWAGVFDFCFLHLTFSFAAYQIFCAIRSKLKRNNTQFSPYSTTRCHEREIFQDYYAF